MDRSRRAIQDSSEFPALRIAFENPAIAYSVAGVLEEFSKENPECEIRLFYGSADEIRRKFITGDLDCAFMLLESADNSSDEYESLFISMKLTDVCSSAVGLSVRPLANEERITKAVWRKSGSSQEMNRFAGQLKLYRDKNH